MAGILLRLYVTGRTPGAARAIATLNALRDEPGVPEVDLQVIDVLDNPEAALNDNIFATPTVIRIRPGPIRRIFGDLTSKEMLLVGLQLLNGDSTTPT